jgi:Ca-activated chloride channel family protein
MKPLSLASVALTLLVAVAPAHAMGILLPNGPGTTPLAIQSHRVDIRITDGAAVTHVDQVFRNDSGQQLEATFLFPLPDGSSVSDFALYINGVRTVGEVLEASRARSIYNDIVRRIQDPGLVEYVDGRLFQASIFPVPANGTQRVELEFAQVLEREGDLRRLVYPLRTGRTSGTTLQDFTLSVAVEASDPLRSIYSPSHEVEVVRTSERTATVGLEQQRADLEQDFVLYLSASDDPLAIDLLRYDRDGSGGEDGYFLMVVAPRLESEGQIPAKDVTLVVDTSGSMAGDKIVQAQATIRHIVSQLNPSDRFNVVRFSTTTRSLFADLTPVTDESRAQAIRFADDIRAAGGTAIEEALATALRQTTSPDRPHLVIFVTDGLPTIGETDAAALVRRFAPTEGTSQHRIFTFGVGFDVDTTLLDTLAAEHRGVSDYVRPGEDIENAVSTLYARIAHPVLSDVSVDFGGAAVHDTFPRALPDLFAGQQVVVAGRYGGAGSGPIQLSGRFAGESVSYRFDERLAAGGDSHDFIPQLWATRKIGYLVDQIRLNGETAELRDEVRQLGITYGLVTPYTSYLAVADSEFQGFPGRPGPRFDRDAPTSRLRSGWGAGGALEGEDAAAAAPLFAGDGRLELGNSGQTSVEAAEESRRLQEQTWSDNRAQVRRVGNRVLNYEADGVWRDVDAQNADSDEVVNVQYLSDAYFRLVELRPELARVVSVGERVEVRVNSQVVVQIDATNGLTELDERMERRILAD